MVAEQLRPRGISDPRILSVFESIPRHNFVPESEKEWSYEDYPLPIGLNQTISQPYIVAFMTERLELTGTEKVFEVGTGSGYQAAILSKLALEVFTMEIIQELADKAQKILQDMQIGNVHVYTGDGSLGLPQFSPYDAIIVTAAAPLVPRTLLDQLSPDGRLIMPVGGRGFQELEYWERKGNAFASTNLIPVAFVPLRGQFGWGNSW